MKKIILSFLFVNIFLYSEILNFKKLSLVPKAEKIEKETILPEVSKPVLKKEIEKVKENPPPEKKHISNVEKLPLFSIPFTKKLLVLAEFNPDPENPHKGILYSPIEIGNVISSGEGKVVAVDYMDGYHNYIILEHANNLYTVYGNLNEVLVGEGQSVKKGEILGVLLKEKGLYFQITQGKKTIDPNLFVKN